VWNYRHGFCRGKKECVLKPKFFSRLKNVDEIYRPAMEKMCSILKYFPHQKISFKTVLDPACPPTHCLQNKFRQGAHFSEIKSEGRWILEDESSFLRGRGQKGCISVMGI